MRLNFKPESNQEKIMKQFLFVFSKLNGSKTCYEYQNLKDGQIFLLFCKDFLGFKNADMNQKDPTIIFQQVISYVEKLISNLTPLLATNIPKINSSDQNGICFTILKNLVFISFFKLDFQNLNSNFNFDESYEEVDTNKSRFYNSFIKILTPKKKKNDLQFYSLFCEIISQMLIDVLKNTTCYENKIKTLIEEKDRLKNDLNEKNEIIKKIENIVQNISDENRQLQENIQKICKEKAVLQNRLQDYEKINTIAFNENKELDSMIESLKKDMNILYNQIDDLKTQLKMCEEYNNWQEEKLIRIENNSEKTKEKESPNDKLIKLLDKFEQIARKSQFKVVNVAKNLLANSILGIKGTTSEISKSFLKQYLQSTNASKINFHDSMLNNRADSKADFIINSKLIGILSNEKNKCDPKVDNQNCHISKQFLLSIFEEMSFLLRLCSDFNSLN